MTAKAALHQAILAAFKAEDAEQETAAAVLTDLAVAFADVLCGEPVAASIELDTEDMPRQVLCEIRELIHEIRADRQERAQAMRQLRAGAGGLPG